MKKLRAILGILALAVTVGAANSKAQVLNFGPSSTNVDIFANNNGTVSVGLGCDIGTCTLSGGAVSFIAGDTGTYTFTTTNDNAINVNGGLLVGGLIPPSTSLHSVNPNGTTTTLALSMADGDTLSGNVTWTTVNDGSPQPRFNFTLSGVTDSGDAAWLSLFSGASLSGDITLNAMKCNFDPSPNNCSVSTLEAVSNTGDEGSATLSSGELVATAPEPGSLLLLGTGLLSFGGLLRRRILGA